MQLQSLDSPFLKSPLLPNPTFSRTPFASPVDDDVEPSVTLHEWWLAKVEGHEREISVAGFYMEKQEVLEFSAGFIVMRHGPCRLETEDGIIVFTLGYFNIERTLENGFTIEACERFSLGFPFWWKDWNMYYPNIMRSQTLSQPRSSRISSSCDDSNVSSACMVNLTNDLGRDNDSHENKGCHKTIATHVNSSEKCKEPAGTSRKQTIKKSAASNHDSNKVGNIETDLIGTRTSKENSHDGIDRNAPSASTGVCINDKGHVGKDTSSHINNGHQKTDLPSLKRRDCLKKPKPSSEDSQNLSYSSEISLVQSSMQGNPHLTRRQAKLSSVSLPESLNLQRTRSGQVVVPTQDAGSQIVVYDHGKPPAGTSKKQTIKKSAGSNRDSNKVANIETYGHLKTSRKAQRCLKKPKNESEDVQSLMKGNTHTRHQAKLLSVSLPESLNLQRTRSGRIVVPKLDAGCQNIVYDHDGSISAIEGYRGSKVCK